MTRLFKAILILGVSLLLASGLALGCVVSPQPSPPNLSPDGLSRRGDRFDIIDGYGIVGDPQTVDPPEGVVVATNLDGIGPATVEPVRADGSFELIVGAGRPGDTFRLQVRNGGARSVPVDVVGVLEEGAELTPAPHPVGDCLVLDPSYEIDFGDVRTSVPVERTLLVENHCASTLEFEAPFFREPDAPFEVGAEPLVLAPDASVEVTVRAAPSALGSTEATLFLRTTSPEIDRRALTLFTRGIE